MVKEPKNVDFVTTGRDLSEEFARISEWIRQDKQKQAARKPAEPTPAAQVPGSRLASRSHALPAHLHLCSLGRHL